MDGCDRRRTRACATSLWPATRARRSRSRRSRSRWRPAPARPLRTTVLVGAAILTGQLSVGWSNDWIDAGRDAAVGRTDKPVGDGRLPCRPCGRRPCVRARGLRRAVVRARLAGRARPSGDRRVGVGVQRRGSRARSGRGRRTRSRSASCRWRSRSRSRAHPSRRGGRCSAARCSGIGAHGANVVPDLQDDRATGVRGLPHRVGGTARRASGRRVALVAATVLVVLAPRGNPSIGAAAALVVGARSDHPRHDDRARRGSQPAAVHRRDRGGGGRRRPAGPVGLGGPLSRRLDFERTRRGRLQGRPPPVEGASRARRRPPHAVRLGAGRRRCARSSPTRSSAADEAGVAWVSVMDHYFQMMARRASRARTRCSRRTRRSATWPA